ncbi:MULTISPECIES: TauD/TfdA family dioxygenase [Xanthomonas]|uniref:TauD/TfdA family dioxygenase n=1 Tax=Xanthomonas hortorum pv. hederae TaxID=453603 RepID=A0A9X4BVV6_9XANT|nr:TauD/TfdA family dioxygenase [Xanthomonas arboricola]MDC8640403.1 TauD/TfdA family dioxygenase [Xanthomonas hortorum pv. hederae]SOU08899.1 syrp like protein, albicidin biosynthesis regulation [Xanthomonas arboricola pv. fragariae]
MKFSDYRKVVTPASALPAEQDALLDLVEIASNHDELPIFVTPKRPIDLAAWLAAAAPSLHALADTRGALLFRGFSVHGAVDMERCVRNLIGEPMDYRENTSPRTAVRGNIRTSTDYPETETILLHNEHSYSRLFPMRVFFHCTVPASSGGNTPIADCGGVQRRIDPAIVQRFRERGWLYVRNFVAEVGQSWQTVYQCEDRDTLERLLDDADIGFEWNAAGRLRTRILRPAESRHPTTGESLWLNHLLFWHFSSLDLQMQRMIRSEFGESELPHQTYYGDGEPIEEDVLANIREAYEQERRAFAWQAGDLLMLDNMKVAHGRDAYVGPRNLLFAMGHPYDRRNSNEWIRAHA